MSDENPDKSISPEGTLGEETTQTDAARAASFETSEVDFAPSGDLAAEAASPADAAHDATGSAAEPHAAPPQYGVGPFSVREVAIGGAWLLAFIVSFFPVNLVVGPAAALVGGANVWVSGLSWILPIGVPTVAVFLLGLRRLSPEGIRRVGSLGIDQFASVAFTVAAVVWLQAVWETVAIAAATGTWVRSWVIWVELFLMLAGVVLTVLAPFIPGLEQDFQDRRETPAHRNARPVRPVAARPHAPRPQPAPAPASGVYDTGFVSAAPATHGAGAPEAGGYAPAYAEPAADTSAYSFDLGASGGNASDTGSHDTDVFAPLRETTTHENVAESPSAPAPQVFWALVPVEREVVDEYGRPIFRIGPTAWALVIEDRGEVFVIRHEDGRVGYLHDVSGVTRG